MENKVLQKNLEAVSKYDKKLVNKILMLEKEKSTFKNKYSISITQNGEYNLFFNNIPIHNQISPVIEAKNIIQNITDENNTIRVIFGLGLGYLADELAQKIKKSPILVYEPSLELINLVFNLANIDALYKDNVILCNDLETFKNHILNFANEDTKITISFIDFYKNNYKDEIKEVLNCAQFEQGKKKANVNTIINKAPGAIYNTLCNLKYFPSCAFIEEFFNVYKDKNALILSAGPSCADNIELIKKHRNKFIIFAVSSIVKLLSQNNITADFIIDIESFGQNCIFKDLDISKSYLILEAFSHFSKFETNSKGKILYISKDNFLNNHLRKIFNITTDFKTFGTVTYSAINACYILGFKNIVLLGSDLAFKNGKCYAKGSQYDNLEYIFDDKENKYKITAPDIKEFAKKLFNSDEQSFIDFATKRLEFLNQNVFTVKGTDGKLLPSLTSYALFIEYFKELACEIKAKAPETKLYNCSKGAIIEGFEDVSFDELMSSFDEIQAIELEIKKKQISQKLIEDINLILKYLNDYLTITRNLIQSSKKIINELKNKKVLTQNILQKIRKHNQELGFLLKFEIPDDLNILFAKNNYLIIPLIEKMNIQNVQDNIRFFEKLSAIYNDAERNCLDYIFVLTNSQSFIVQ